MMAWFRRRRARSRLDQALDRAFDRAALLGRYEAAVDIAGMIQRMPNGSSDIAILPAVLAFADDAKRRCEKAGMR